MTDRVAVFIDWQNCYHGARDAFADPGSPPELGVVDPVALAHNLVDGRPTPGKLVDVEVFRGRPDPAHQPSASRAYRRQLCSWSRYVPLLQVHCLPVSYRPTAWDANGRALAWDGHEKGIDTTMAIRLVLGAERRNYDVAIVFTADTDLQPAVDAVFASGLAAETATWAPADRGRNVSRPIVSLRWPTVVHRLGKDRFEAVWDRSGADLRRAG